MGNQRTQRTDTDRGSARVLGGEATLPPPSWEGSRPEEDGGAGSRLAAHRTHRRSRGAGRTGSRERGTVLGGRAAAHCSGNCRQSLGPFQGVQRGRRVSARASSTLVASGSKGSTDSDQQCARNAMVQSAPRTSVPGHVRSELLPPPPRSYGSLDDSLRNSRQLQATVGRSSYRDNSLRWIGTSASHPITGTSSWATQLLARIHSLARQNDAPVHGERPRALAQRHGG